MTTRFEVWVGRIITYLLAIICLVLAYFNWIAIDAAKLEIISQIQSVAIERKSEIAVLSGSLEDIRNDMDKHREWSRSIDSELVKRESTWIDRTEFIEWCEESRRLNPSLSIPAIEAIKHTQERMQEELKSGIRVE